MKEGEKKGGRKEEGREYFVCLLLCNNCCLDICTFHTFSLCSALSCELHSNNVPY